MSKGFTLTNPNPCDGGQNCKCEPGNYYVSCVDGEKWWPMAGPYKTHQKAVADKNRVYSIAADYDSKSVWKAWGTLKMSSDIPGRMNKLGLL